MASPFWTYFHERLRWGLIHSPGPLQAFLRGLAHSFDRVREDAIFLRAQWFPQLCETDMVPFHGLSRGITRYYKESQDQFRRRVINAYAWHMLGGKQEGVPQILEFYGFPGVIIENMASHSQSRWAEFQVALRDVQSMEEYAALIEDLGLLIWLLKEYKPARSRLFRVYNNSYDVRPIAFTNGPTWSNGWYSFFSGVVVPDIDDDTLISLGWRVSVHLDHASAVVQFGADMVADIAIPYTGGDAHLAVSTEYSVHFCEAVYAFQQWRGHWDHRPWAVLIDWIRPGALTQSHNPGIETELAARLPQAITERPDSFHISTDYDYTPRRLSSWAGHWSARNWALGLAIA